MSMTHTNITNFRKNLFEYVNQALDYNDVINVNTKSGNVVMMSEEDYRGLLETLYLSSVTEISLYASRYCVTSSLRSGR